LVGEGGGSDPQRGAERLDAAVGIVADAIRRVTALRALRAMQGDALAHAVNDALELVNAARFDISDGAGGRLVIEVEVAVGSNEAEGHDLDRAATALGVKRDPEFAPSSGGGAEVYQNEGHKLFAEGVEELDWRARGADIVASHAKLRKQRNGDGVIALKERNERRGAARVLLQRRPSKSGLCHGESQLPRIRDGRSKLGGVLHRTFAEAGGFGCNRSIP
jgi:hypothetical protein